MIKRVTGFCYTVRGGFLAGILSGLPMLSLPNKYGWSMNWILVGWISFCTLGLFLAFEHGLALKRTR